MRTIIGECKNRFGKAVTIVNAKFNGLPKKRKKLAILLFGICVTGISGMLIIHALGRQENKVHFKPEKIAMPYDIFKTEDAGVSEDHLIPVGKMKGDIEGEFESFYVAVDNKGNIFINRDIDYSEKAYEKSDDWKQISREKLMEFEKQLHFMPSRSRGVKR